MDRKNKSNLKSRLISSPYFSLILIVSLLFGILFVRYILGEYAFVYQDIGSDTFNINYPLYYMFSDVFRSGKFEDYYLNVGLGMDMSSYVFQYLNPINLIVVLLPQHLIPWGILLATYIKLLLLAVFGYKLFEKWIGQVWGSFAAAVVWTFSGYVMLWGQHYGFCTSVMMFTVFLYLVHLFADDRERSRNGILVLWITLLLFTNYYFLYISGIAGAVYVAVYLAFRGESWKKILRKLLGLAGMGILGICIGGVCLVPTYNVFLSSTRGGEVSAGSLADYIVPYGPRWLLSFVGRLFSNNTFGVGGDYSAAVNYYEIAELSVSSLFFPGLFYLLLKKETRKKTVILTAGSLVLLALPLTGRLLVMNSGCQRWSFILCLLEALAVGMFVKYLFEESDVRLIRMCVYGGEALAALLCGVLLLGQKRWDYTVESAYLLLAVLFLACYGLLILSCSFRPQMNRIFPALLVILICTEMAVMNYPTLNFRVSPTRHQIATEYYNDGSREAYAWAAAQDPSVYRVAKEYRSGLINDGLGQAYPGFSVYLTTNPGELVSYKNMYGGTGLTDSTAAFNSDNFLLRTLLGMKYVLAKPGYALSPEMSLAGSTGVIDIYEYGDALPFGYLYDSAWDKAEVEAMPVLARTRAAIHGFYYTDPDTDPGSGSGYAEASMQDMRELSLLDMPVEAVDCRAERTKKGIRISDMGTDPNVVFRNVGDHFDDELAQTITVEMDVDEAVEMALYYKMDSSAEEFNGYQLYTFTIYPDNSVWRAIVPGGITDLRLDVSSPAAEVTVTDLRVGGCEADMAAYEKLQKTDIADVRFSDSTYRAEVNNSSDSVRMLCVPLLYSEAWRTAVDGKETELYNINSGLCGIEIPPGSHEVVLRYEMPHRKAGICMSGAGAAVYLIVFGAGWLKRRKLLRRTDAGNNEK